MSLKGKVALVTGAAQGIGKSIAEILLKNGAKVSMLDCDKSEGEATTAAFGQLYGAENILFFHVDITSESQMQDSFIKTMEKFQKLDIVCNNAGIINESNYEKCISVNLVGLIRGSQLALKHMSKGNGDVGGVIVNVASFAAFYPIKHMPVYTASKYGVVGFTKALSLTCMKEHGVRVHALCPSFVDTPLVRIQQKDSKERLDVFLQLYGPIMKPSEIAERFLELVVDQTRNGVVMKILGNGNIEYEDQPEGQHTEAQKPTQRSKDLRQ